MASGVGLGGHVKANFKPLYVVKWYKDGTKPIQNYSKLTPH